MTRKAMEKTVLCVGVLVWAVGMIGCGGEANTNQKANANIVPTPTFDVCAQPDIDLVIMKDIYAKIDKEIGSSEKLHINTMSIGRVVTLKGWTDNKDEYDAVLKLVDTVACRTGTVTKGSFFDQMPQPNVPPDFVRPGSNGCIPPTTRCGEMCIGPNDTCYSAVDTMKQKEEGK